MYRNPEQKDKAILRRRQMERAIVRALISALLNAGYAVSVYNGGDDAEVEKSTNARDIWNASGESDLDEYIVHKDGKREGWIQLVYGNDGWDLISDYSVNLETVLSPVHALAERLQG